MLKKILSTFIAIYIVISVMYLGYVLFPKFSGYFKNFELNDLKDDKLINKTKVLEKEIPTIYPCNNYAIGYISSDNNFSVATRIKNSFNGTLKILDKKLNHNIEDISCDIVGMTTHIFYNSRLYADAIITNYEYTRPVAKKLKAALELKTLIKPLKLFEKALDSGYIIAVSKISNANLSEISWSLSKEEEEILLGTCDTIFFETTGKNPGRTEIEYIAAKTDIDNNSVDDLLILNYWYDKALAKNERYITIFVMLFEKDNSAKRYTLLPFSKIKKANYNIEQVIDLDDDTYKEVVVRLSQGFKDSFIVYDFSAEQNSFILKE